MREEKIKDYISQLVTMPSLFTESRGAPAHLVFKKLPKNSNILFVVNDKVVVVAGKYEDNAYKVVKELQMLYPSSSVFVWWIEDDRVIKICDNTVSVVFEIDFIKNLPDILK